MPLVEINFDGIVGPSHNYAGLSLGNIASATSAGIVSHPRAAALQGLDKMRGNLSLGLAQGFFVPPPRPNLAWLARLGIGHWSMEPRLIAAAWSASAMWTANAATVSPAPDTVDGRCHLTPANLVTMPHRSHEWPDTARQLALAFADDRYFALHDPVPPCFGDEGAANHMRMAVRHDAPGLEIFVHGRAGARFPARQHLEASRTVARLHGLAAASVLFVEQSSEAIAAGAFHNDVVAVANEHMLLTHEQAFAEPEHVYDSIRERLPAAEIIVVPADRVSLAEAVRSYLFNAQLVTLPGAETESAGTALIVPTEAWESAPVHAWLDELLADQQEHGGPIRQIIPTDVRQSMANGGGPACLRLRVLADPGTVNQRFLLDEAKADQIAAVIEHYWPQRIAPGDLADPALAERIAAARAALLETLKLEELG